MIDQRERVLAHCAALIATVPGVVQTARNAGEVTGKRRPAIIQDDGTEEVVDEDAGSAGGSKNSLVQRMRLDVAFRILVEAPAEAIGPLASQLRSDLIVTLFSDDTLLDLLGVAHSRSTRIKFVGSMFDTSDGEQREGTMTVNLAFTYVFKLADLVE